MRAFAAGFVLVVASAAYCADFSGDWLAEVTSEGAETQYARVHLQVQGLNVSGTWNQLRVTGAANGDQLSLLLARNEMAAGALKGALSAGVVSGDGKMIGVRGGGGGQENSVAWKLTRPAQARAGGPKTFDFMEPPVFHGYYSATNPPVLRVQPGDTVKTRTYDAARDLNKRTPGSDLETGPFYVEGALPGDTLVVKLNKLRVNRDSARQGSRINTRAVTPEFVGGAKYDADFNSEWILDRAKGVATMAHPTERMKNFSVPILPMLGCISTAPAGDEVYRGTDLGAYGGNMDYNLMGEGVTLYLPVYHPGALVTLGDAHAAMGDGELTGAALETSADVEFTVDVIRGYASAGPRLENADYIMAMGITGSLADSLQLATSQMVEWLKRDYKLSDSEIAIFLGAVLKYDVTELVDPHLNVVARVPKSALNGLR
jgi:amidase